MKKIERSTIIIIVLIIIILMCMGNFATHGQEISTDIMEKKMLETIDSIETINEQQDLNIENTLLINYTASFLVLFMLLYIASVVWSHIMHEEYKDTFKIDIKNWIIFIPVLNIIIGIIHILLVVNKVNKEKEINGS